MRFLAIASDFDGTLARDGTVTSSSLEAIGRLKASGRKFILVTGRQLDELKQTFPNFAICDLIIAENGATVWDPKTREEIALVPAPPPRFAEELRARGVQPLAVGRVIVATWQPHEVAVFETIRDLGLELNVIFNKGAVMILPSGVNKASGLHAALKTIGLSEHNVVGVGDAENDHALLQACEACAVPANGLASLKDEADLVLEGDHGRGVEQLIDALIADDLASLERKLQRHDLLLGETANGTAVTVPAYGASVLIAGTSGGGKSTLATGIIEKLMAQKRQFCIVDPEGDYSELPNAVVFGNPKRAARPEEVMSALQRSAQDCVVNIVSLPHEDRPHYFDKLFAQLVDLRNQTGRPHWLILDETHHIVPSVRQDAAAAQHHAPNLLLLTVEPEHIARTLLESVDLILAIGREPAKTIGSFCTAVGDELPNVPDGPLEKGEVMAWWRRPRGEPFRFRSATPTLPRQRHLRKYAEGDVHLGAFIFRGPDDKLQLRAQNLFIFLQMGEGVDDLTWNHHLRNGDYEKWFAGIIKDPELAGFCRELAKDEGQSAEDTRKTLRAEIEKRYTAPA